jgi:hypothetical protein
MEKLLFSMPSASLAKRAVKTLLFQRPKMSLAEITETQSFCDFLWALARLSLSKGSGREIYTNRRPRTKAWPLSLTCGSGLNHILFPFCFFRVFVLSCFRDCLFLFFTTKARNDERTKNQELIIAGASLCRRCGPGWPP